MIANDQVTVESPGSPWQRPEWPGCAPDAANGIGGLLAFSYGYSSRTGNWVRHYHYHADANGNVTALVWPYNGNHYVVATYRYAPFGRRLGHTGTWLNPLRFSSKIIHEDSGLYDYGFRFYEPETQRWLTRDPIGEWGGINLYGFVGNDPVNGVDPFGHTGWVIALPGFEIGLPTLPEWVSGAAAGGPAVIGGVAAAGGGLLVGSWLDESYGVSDYWSDWLTGNDSEDLYSPPLPLPDRCDTRAHGKGERNRTGRPDGTANPYKHMTPDPTDPTKVFQEDPSTGKRIRKAKPPNFPEPKPKPRRNAGVRRGEPSNTHQ